MYSDGTDQTTKRPQTSEARGRMALFNTHNGIMLCTKIIVRRVLGERPRRSATSFQYLVFLFYSGTAFKNIFSIN